MPLRTSEEKAKYPSMGVFCVPKPLVGGFGKYFFSSIKPWPCDGSETNCLILFPSLGCYLVIFLYLVAVVVVVRFRVVDVSVRGAAGDLKLYVGYYWRGEI